MGNEAVTPAPTCWVSAEPRRTEGERSPREGSGGGTLRAAPPAAHALRPPARCGRLPRRPCGERPPVRGRWARRAPLRRRRGAAGMRGAGRRSRAPRAAALSLALLLASCVQVGGRGGLRSRPVARLPSPYSASTLRTSYIYIYTYMYIVCVYIYIHICAAAVGLNPQPAKVGGGGCTGERSPQPRAAAGPR